MTDKVSNKLETVDGIDIAKETINVFIIAPSIVNDRIKQNMHYIHMKETTEVFQKQLTFVNNIMSIKL